MDVSDTQLPNASFPHSELMLFNDDVGWNDTVVSDLQLLNAACSMVSHDAGISIVFNAGHSANAHGPILESLDSASNETLARELHSQNALSIVSHEAGITIVFNDLHCKNVSLRDCNSDPCSKLTVSRDEH